MRNSIGLFSHGHRRPPAGGAMRHMLFILLTAMLVTGCGGGGGGNAHRPPTVPPTGVPATIAPLPTVVPPAGVHLTIPTDFPPTDKARLEQLALQQSDLPDGFALQYEDANEFQGGIEYIAHYVNVPKYQSAPSDKEFLSLRGPLNIDIEVDLFDTEAASSEVFAQLASMSVDDMIARVRTQKHWSAESTTLVQVGVDASIVPFRAFGEGTFACQTVERVRDSESAVEASFVDYMVYMKRGRAIALVDIGALEEPAATADVESLVEKFDQRLIVAFR